LLTLCDVKCLNEAFVNMLNSYNTTTDMLYNSNKRSKFREDRTSRRTFRRIMSSY